VRIANSIVSRQAFLHFILSHYGTERVRGLSREKLLPLLRLKYREAIANAVAELGKPQGIGILFAGFQNFLQRQEGRKAGCPDVPAGCVTVLGKPQQDGKQFFTAGTQS